MKGILPDGYSWREFWDFKNLIKTTIIPSKIRGGHPLTLTNAAAKRTTTDGVHFTGSATSNMVTAADAVLNDKAKFWACIRFKFDQTFSSASAADQYLMNKTNAGLFVRLRFESDDGKLYWEGDDNAGKTFTLTSTTESWTANTWYTVVASMNDVGPAQRLLIDGSVEDTDTQAAFNTSNGGDLIIGSSSDGGADGFEGTISFVVIGTTALSVNEETDLDAGFGPSDAINFYTMDEGSGTTITCRGSGADNATLDSACTWEFGQTKLACLSFDGIDDYAVSSAGADISGNISIVWVGKMKSTYDSIATTPTWLFLGRVDADNELRLEYNGAEGGIKWECEGSNVSGTALSDETYTIDNYHIFVGTLTDAGVITLYENGILEASDTGVGAVSGAAATLYLGSTEVPDEHDISKPIVVGVINGALSARDALILSRKIDQRYTLGIGV